MSTASLSTAAAPARKSRIALLVVMVAAYWILYAAVEASEITRMHRFLFRLVTLGILLLTFLGWWLFHRGTPRRDKLIALSAAALAFVAMTLFRDASIHGPLMMGVVLRGIELTITGWTFWLFFTHGLADAMRRRGMIVVAAAAWLGFLALRTEGLDGEAGASYFWRWTPSGEEQFLADLGAAQHADATPPMTKADSVLEVTDEDWPEFRGPQRNGASHGITIDAKWSESPPKQLWKRRVGPGWSSIAVVGNRLFTQEQRGDEEAVISLDAATGDPIWVHADSVRFDEAMGGVGPRATPTVSDGRVFALGATGTLNCLDAATGKLHWSRDIKIDGQQSTPIWGFCSSPLVVDGHVIVFAGGGGGSYGENDSKRSDAEAPAPAGNTAANQQTLVAYDIVTGQPAWRSQSGNHSYSSPQLAEFDGQKQVLFVSDMAVEAVDSANGARLWALPANDKNGAPAIQPHVLGNDEFLAAFTGDSGLLRARVKRKGDQWDVDVEWVSRDLKPFFSDFVRVGDALYGFDGKYFTCVNAETGKRHWKGGRYGSGQVLLLADQPALLVISEAGEAILVAANPEKHQELGRFQAIEGKTWNHPTIVRDRLYVRNAEEMACYALSGP